MKALGNDLNLICGENGLILFEGKVKLPTLPYDAKRLYAINSEHYLARLIVDIFMEVWNMQQYNRYFLSYVKNLGFAEVMENGS